MKWLRKAKLWLFLGILLMTMVVIGHAQGSLRQTYLPIVYNRLPPTLVPTPTFPPAWLPDPVTTWQWQLDASLDLNVAVQFYDIDLFDNTAEVVGQLHAQGKKVACYLSAGSWENWRPDAAQFSAAVLGKAYSGWPGERWLDIRRLDVLGPIMEARLDLCRAKGFDAVEADNVDGYTNDTGFPLTFYDQLYYNTWLARQAHARGLSIGLKNDPEQVKDLLPYFDWALTEDCLAEGWCEQLEPFVQNGKAVFAAEYTDSGFTPASFCQRVAQFKTDHPDLIFNFILKRRSLDAWRVACP